jgi:hypothetical protein
LHEKFEEEYTNGKNRRGKPMTEYMTKISKDYTRKNNAGINRQAEME